MTLGQNVLKSRIITPSCRVEYDILQLLSTKKTTMYGLNYVMALVCVPIKDVLCDVEKAVRTLLEETV